MNVYVEIGKALRHDEPIHRFCLRHLNFQKVAYPRREPSFLNDKRDNGLYMEMRRIVVSTIIGLLLIFLSAYLIYSGGVPLTDFLTQLAVGLILLAIGVMFWGFKPIIMNWMKRKEDRKAIIRLIGILYLFVEHWNTYKKLILEQTLMKPQNGEIKWCSDQMKSRIAYVRLLRIKDSKPILDMLSSIANEMTEFGMDVLNNFPSERVSSSRLSNHVIDDLVKRGDELEEELKQIIPKVEDFFGYHFQTKD